MKLKPLAELPPRYCPVCDGHYTGQWAIQDHNLRCARFGERSYWKAAGLLTLVILFAIGGYVDAFLADTRVWGAQVVANCPNHEGIRYPSGRIHRYPPCEPARAK